MSKATTDPIEELARAPERFDFYAALRLLDAGRPIHPRLGESRSPRQDPVRLGQPPYLEFPPATLAGLRPRSAKRPPWLQIYCFGLFGPNGPLPLHWTEYAEERMRHADDPGFAAFCDLFHHRLISLFYRAWAQKEPAVERDRPEGDRFAFYLDCLSGYGLAAQRGLDAMPEALRHFFTAHLARQAPNTEGLRTIVSNHFGVPVQIEEFVAEWLPIPAASRSRLGQAALGEAVIGSHSFQRASRFRLRLGPLALEDYERFLPAGNLLGVLSSIVCNWVGWSLAWELQLLLQADEAPAPRLGGSARLGWSLWIGRVDERTAPLDDLLLAPAACTVTGTVRKDEVRSDPHTSEAESSHG